MSGQYSNWAPIFSLALATTGALGVWAAQRHMRWLRVAGGVLGTAFLASAPGVTLLSPILIVAGLPLLAVALIGGRSPEGPASAPS